MVLKTTGMAWQDLVVADAVFRRRAAERAAEPVE
jgi:ornithine cyclodeaminase/alanine dehydrogenase-like protein (mu-crystallin family)